ncbi:MAG: PH domain-containing protein [Thermomicrobiales bacterium]
MNGEPATPLDPRARLLWRIEARAPAAMLGLSSLGLRWVALQSETLPDVIAPAALLIGVAGIAWLIGFGPSVRWRWWRYGIERNEVDLAYGWFTRTRTVIPMARIQHVDTVRGPVERRLGLATVVLHTAAGSNVIPALADADAAAVRERISSLANVRQDL